MLPEPAPNFSISIVSHGHRNLILSLLDDLARTGRSDIEVILTWNLPDEDSVIVDHFPFQLTHIVNRAPKGFAANHNAAFLRSNAGYFVVLNPDIRLPEDPFNVLLNVLKANPNAICAPLILNAEFEREDSARLFPSPWTLIKKATAKMGGIRPIAHQLRNREQLFIPDWIAGMFMVIPKAVYVNLKGLSERYFLYYEDVDFCARAKLIGVSVIVAKNAFAIHDARRESHRNLHFLVWHLTSAFKFFTSYAYLKLRLKALFKV